MSADYSANYGIGYKVCASEHLEDIDEMEDGLNEYIDGECEEEFESFEVGSAYTGEIDGVYLAIKFPFIDGLDLTAAKERTDKEVERLHLETEGEFGMVGGLYIS